jgi:hypothetical protein
VDCGSRAPVRRYPEHYWVRFPARVSLPEIGSFMYGSWMGATYCLRIILLIASAGTVVISGTGTWGASSWGYRVLRVTGYEFWFWFGLGLVWFGLVWVWGKGYGGMRSIRKRRTEIRGKEGGRAKKGIRRRPTLPRIPSAVPSALEGLTSGFGMEPGVSPPPGSPDTSFLLSSCTCDRRRYLSISEKVGL